MNRHLAQRFVLSAFFLFSMCSISKADIATLVLKNVSNIYSFPDPNSTLLHLVGFPTSQDTSANFRLVTPDNPYVGAETYWYATWPDTHFETFWGLDNGDAKTFTDPFGFSTGDSGTVIAKARATMEKSYTLRAVIVGFGQLPTDEIHTWTIHVSFQDVLIEYPINVY
jgi:hypothetical protein